MEHSSFYSLPAKRPLDTSGDLQRYDSYASGSVTSMKRRHSSTTRPPPPPLKAASGETLFRILCPADKTGAVIGKGGSIISHFRQATGAKIRIGDSVPTSDERVIHIVGPASVDPARKHHKTLEHEDNATDEISKDMETDNWMAEGLALASPAQQALLKVFERMVKVDGPRSTGNLVEGDDGGEKVGPTSVGVVVCRLLAPSNHVGCVLGKGGRIVEKIRQESGAQIRVLAKEQLPACAESGDELIQITGSISSVRKALLSVSSCLQDNPRSDTATFLPTKPLGATTTRPGPPAQLDPFPHRGFTNSHHASDYLSKGYSSSLGSDSLAVNHGRVPEEEIVFRLLCANTKVGSLIGKGGGIVRTLQSETGAMIKVLESTSESEERVVLISALENSELKYSRAQEALMRVHSLLADMGSEIGALVSARLLVPAQQIGCLLGKGGAIIAEMRRATGATIRILVKDQIPKCAAANEELVQVSGSVKSVQEALFHITSRLRESIIPMKSPGVDVGTYSSVGPDVPTFAYRSRHEPTSPVHFSPSMGHHHAPHPLDHQPPLSHSKDHIGLGNTDRVPYPYSNERSGHASIFDRPSSPRSWAAPALRSGSLRGTADMGAGLAPRSGTTESSGLAAVVRSTTVEVEVPQQLLGFIYGENGSNLSQIRQMSGAKVIIHDPRPGATEGIVVISGSPDQTRAAQSLLHAFILCGQTKP